MQLLDTTFSGPEHARLHTVVLVQNPIVYLVSGAVYTQQANVALGC